MDQLPPPAPPPSPAPQIGQIKRVGTDIFVTALIREDISRTPGRSSSKYRLEEFEWRKFQLQDGAETALRSLPPELCSQIEEDLSLKLETTSQYVQPGDAEKCSVQILFGPMEEPDLAVWAFGVILGNVRSEVTVDCIHDTRKAFAQRLRVCASMLLLSLLLLLYMGAHFEVFQPFH